MPYRKAITVTSLLFCQHTYSAHANERISALECWQGNQWTLVNTHNDGKISLSWGELDTTLARDVAVTLVQTESQKQYSGLRLRTHEKIELRVDIPSGGNKGTGRFLLWKKDELTPTEWPSLDCELFAED